ncbi:MAG: ornithine cyclodeaminase family protein, partial [Anaerolineaceae bacterium]|nr:ornithine cyclodeaminase family protein [Anaerolineaceae bacterium]
VQNGLPVCIIEGNWVTGLRTAASTTITAKRLARRNSEVITIIGAGLQGSMHMGAMAEGFDLRKANIIDISPEAASHLAARFEAKLGFPIRPMSIEQREDAVRESDIIITVTTGNQALIENAWLKPGVFIAKLGSYREIASDIILEADKVIVDDWRYVSPRIPELKELIQSGSFNVENIHAEWREVVSGQKTGRETDSEIIVFIALGIWGEYAAILPEVYRQAKKLGLGRTIK